MPKRIAKPKALRKRTYIREWREFRKLTQDELAVRVGMSKGQLSRIENAIQPYQQDFLDACAAALQTSTGALIERAPTDEDVPWDILDQANPSERKQLIDVMKAVLGKKKDEP